MESGDLHAEYGAFKIDYADVKGQESAKRAVTVASTGRHHLLMIGSPGTGEPEDIESGHYGDFAASIRR